MEPTLHVTDLISWSLDSHLEIALRETDNLHGVILLSTCSVPTTLPAITALTAPGCESLFTRWISTHSTFRLHLSDVLTNVSTALFSQKIKIT